MFSSVVLVGNAVGAIVFGYVAHGLGYATMWTVLAQVMAIGFLVSLKLRPAPLRRVAALPAAAGTRKASAS